MDLVIPSVEEQLAIRLTSCGGGAHDEGDPGDMLGDEEVWAMVGMLVDSFGARAETTKDVE